MIGHWVGYKRQQLFMLTERLKWEATGWFEGRKDPIIWKCQSHQSTATCLLSSPSHHSWNRGTSSLTKICHQNYHQNHVSACNVASTQVGWPLIMSDSKVIQEKAGSRLRVHLYFFFLLSSRTSRLWKFVRTSDKQWRFRINNCPVDLTVYKSLEWNMFSFSGQVTPRM